MIKCDECNCTITVGEDFKEIEEFIYCIICFEYYENGVI